MDDRIRPDVHIALKLPSGLHKVVQLKPNLSVSLGKYGVFNANDLLGRPFYHTYEIVDEEGGKRLRIVSAAELQRDHEVSDADANTTSLGPDGESKDQAQFEVVDQSGKVLMRTNQDILDNAASQKLTMEEIESLKKAESASGRDIIAKLMESHSELDKKTAFSLAKYTTRKASKYLRRFVPLPLDVSMLLRWWLYEKDPAKIMEMREEMLALTLSYSNVHFTQNITDIEADSSRGRWLVVDETGGLVVAAMAERLGILYPKDNDCIDAADAKQNENASQVVDGKVNGTLHEPKAPPEGSQRPPAGSAAIVTQESHMSATENTLHLVHANAQPNLSLLTYFGYDYSNSSPSHPLHRYLKLLSWLQLLHPDQDALYMEPEVIGASELATMKSNKRGAYYRKRRRWQKHRNVIDEARAGQFDGLVICSPMTPVSPARHLVPLLRGGAPIVVYSPTIEPLTELADYYSTARRNAFLALSAAERVAALETGGGNNGEDDDFPVDPTLLLNPCIYTARANPWQVLPGRTHPLMTGLGGAQGYILTAMRAIPAEGEVLARGQFKRRKTTNNNNNHNSNSQMTPNITATTEMNTTVGVGGAAAAVSEPPSEAIAS